MKNGQVIRILLQAFTACAAAAPGAARAEASARNPFWPVGYQPEFIAPVEIVTPETAREMDAAAAALVEKGWKEALRRLDVRGSSRMADGRSLALINRRAYAVGEVVRIAHGGRTYAWKVVKIDLSGVTLERYNQNVAEPEGPASSSGPEPSKGTEKGDTP